MHWDPPADKVGDPTSALVSPAHAFISLYSMFHLFITIFTIIVTSHVASVTAQSPGLLSAWMFFLFYFWPDALTTGKILRILGPKSLAKFRVGNTMNSPVESARRPALSKACWGGMQFIRAWKHSGLGKGLLGAGFSQNCGHTPLLELPPRLSHQDAWLWPPPSVFTAESTATLLRHASVKLPVPT